MTKHIASAVVAIALLSGVGAGCSSKSNSDVRGQVRDALVKGGMPAKQADCLVGKLTDSMLNQIRGGKSPSPGSADFQAYSKSVQNCISVK